MKPTTLTNLDPLVRGVIEQNVANFALRDEGQWEARRDRFHPQATIASSSYRGPIDGCIAASRALGRPTKPWSGGPRLLGRGERAGREVKVAILARTKIRPPLPRPHNGRGGEEALES